MHGCGQIFRSGEGFIQGAGQVELVAAAGNGGEFSQLLIHSRRQALGDDAHFLQKLGSQTAVLLQQRRQQVQLLQLLMTAGTGDGLGKLDGLDGFLGTVVEVHIHTPFQRKVLALSTQEC